MKIQINLIVFGLVILFISVAILYFTQGKSSEKALQQVPQVQTANQNELETQTSQVENITIKVTPQDISKSSSEWKFEVTLDTHSGSLDQDLQKTSVLLDNKGNQYKPTAWEGSPAGGHHREGVLKFRPISSTTIELKIIDFVGSQSQIFKWTLKTD
ncbi:MAG: hypothetical protein HY429_04205 [Candidatus Levybacteria bacterium]|nr:hypothetical protein [Candidatus Levybacteria bacterium]